MKKMFTLIAAAALVLTANAQNQSWDFSSLENGEYTTDPGLNGLTFYVTSEVDAQQKKGSLTVAGSNKTIAGVSFSKVLKWGGKTWDDGNKSLSFAVTGSCKISLYAASANSNDIRHAIIATSKTNNVEDASVLKVFDVVPSGPAKYDYEYEGDAATIYICSSDGFNLYGIATAPLQFYKSFTTTTFFPLTTDKISAAQGEGWLEGATTQATKKSTINPETGETQEATNAACVTVKKGNGSKLLKVYVKGVEKLYVFGASGSSDVARSIVVTATPSDGTGAIEGKAESANASTTVAASVSLDSSKKYAIDITGVEGEGGGDCNVFGIAVNWNGTTGIETIVTKTVANGVAYNLSGQKVGNDYKGIVIINGKKMLHK